MCIAIFPQKRTVGVEHRTRVVIYAGGATLEKRSDDDDSFFLCYPRQRFARWARNRFRKVEEFGVFLPAEIFAVK